jgi:hypothetical protein
LGLLQHQNSLRDDLIPTSEQTGKIWLPNHELMTEEQIRFNPTLAGALSDMYTTYVFDAEWSLISLA